MKIRNAYRLGEESYLGDTMPRSPKSHAPPHRKPRHIKPHHVAAIALASALAGGGAHWAATPTAPAAQPVAHQDTAAMPVCDPTLWDHVYHAYRLQVIDPCRRVTGTVNLVRQEGDGDDHVQLSVDPPYESMLNDANRQKQNGALVLEIICQGHTVTQVDAIQACMNYQNQIPEPAVGEHVVAVGSYVSDGSHGGWLELHPLTSLLRG